MRWVAALRAMEAAALLLVASAAQRWAPPGKWQVALGRPTPVPQGWVGQRIDVRPPQTGSIRERRVAAAVARGVRVLPWTPTCLAQAAAGQVMLQLRGEPGVVVIGLRKEVAGTWAAHAWLIGRAGVITGGPAAVGFTPTAVYERPSGLRAAELPLG